MPIGQGSSEPSNRHACASCKHQRRKCNDCVLSPYFPADKSEEFKAVHRVFGVSNMTKMLKNIKPEQRREAVKSLLWEARAWEEDPVRGPLGVCKKLEKEIKALKSLSSRMVNNNYHHQQNRILPCLTQSGDNNGGTTCEINKVKIDNSNGEGLFYGLNYDNQNLEMDASIDGNFGDLLQHEKENMSLNPILEQDKLELSQALGNNQVLYNYNNNNGYNYVHYDKNYEQQMDIPPNYANPGSLQRARLVRGDFHHQYPLNSNLTAQRAVDVRRQQHYLMSTNQNYSIPDCNNQASRC